MPFQQNPVSAHGMQYSCISSIQPSSRLVQCKNQETHFKSFLFLFSGFTRILPYLFLKQHIILCVYPNTKRSFIMSSKSFRPCVAFADKVFKSPNPTYAPFHLQNQQLLAEKAYTAVDKTGNHELYPTGVHRRMVLFAVRCLVI